MPAAPTFYPVLRYRDANAAIEWLARAFGFEPLLVVPDDRGGVAHAQLAFGEGVVMLGSEREPGDAGRNRGPYVFVEDVDGHYARALSAGAEITRELEGTPYGSREYSVRDLEGNDWSFGTYRPSVRG